ncbi:SDR family NAD(P)-dependent oxidoreductase [Anthocerotibacter panamensis]|uniref:SDR family NAD(P)-dependent oxidoreductase n=1 Tax=Anthocerotibacter panamensis TaxID=2857077 RepID=UPI001C40401A|nr:SDR family NAD(P)-dependent oxidoreductase [Anthocerotibacter panamensis]
MAPRVCLITDDGCATSVAVAQALAERGWHPVMLRFPRAVVPQPTPLTSTVPTVSLADMQEEHLQQQLATITQAFGPIGALIHLHPASHLPVDQQALLSHLFLLAKHLKDPLHNAVPGGRSSFLTVTRLDGRFGLTGQGYDPLAGACFGLTKTLNQEWGAVFCRALDLSPELSSQAVVKCILGEFYDPDRLTVEIAYTPTERATLVGSPAPIPQGGAGLQPSEVFLVSGGAKGITAQCVVQMAERYRARFILLGRSPRSPEPAWSKGCLDEAALKQHIVTELRASGDHPKPMQVQEVFRRIQSERAIAQTLQAIAQAGGQAEYVCADVTDPRLQALIAPAVARLGPVTGILHGAGELADRLIEKKTLQDFTKVFGVKVRGLHNLLATISHPPLKYVVLFSSVAGFYGNVGQADYAMANEVLNKTAYRLKAQLPDCRIIAINWGPWASGMVTPELKKLFEERNIAVLPVAVGTRLLLAELVADGPCQVVLGSPLRALPHPDLPPKVRIRRVLNPIDNPFLDDHRLGEHLVLPFTCASAWVIHSCEQLCPGYTFFRYSDARLLKGIVFTKLQPQEFTLDLEAAAQEDTVVFRATLWSINEQGKTLYHYKGTVHLVRQVPEASHYPALDLAETHLQDGSDLYDRGILFHGPSLAGVQQILNLSAEKITVQCRLPALSDQMQGQFPVRTFNPYTADVSLHPVLIYTQHYLATGGLPSRIPLLEQFRPLPWDETFYVSVEVRNQTPSELVADVIAHDATGNIYIRLHEGAFTRGDYLRELFAQTAAQRQAQIAPVPAVSKGGDGWRK